jgi:8-oxo-dGTP pyrophosphatase MutT (NUDIX family)
VSRQVARAEYSSGGVVYRKVGDNDYEVALVYRKRHDDWSLPKGHIEEGETREETALREVKEETGLDARIVEPLGEVVYFYRRRNGDLVRKTVYHFLLEALSDKFAEPSWEVTESRWVPITEAQTLLSYKNDAGVVAKAMAALGVKP